jgi:hypothetical protein
MNFLNPFALLWLLAVPALVLLYFLKLKRPQIRVPSTLLWRKVVEDMRVNSPFQKLRRSLLLLLQILALLAVIFALARPLLRVRQDLRESLIVLLDNSASMSAREENGATRLDLARDQIRKLVDNLAADDEMMLIVFHSRAKVACGFTSNRRLLREALAAATATECPTDLEPALQLARSIGNSRSHPRVLLFSDGAFRPPRAPELAGDLEFQPVGAARPNLAITGLDIRRSLSDPARIDMFVAAENFSKTPFSGNMVVRLDGNLLDSKYFTVGPEETLSQVFEASLPAGGCVAVEFDAPDALACDNRAWKVVRPPVKRRVLLVGENTYFLERALRSSRDIELLKTGAADYADDLAAGVSAVIWNNVPNPSVAPCHNLYFHCAPAIEGLAAGEKIEAPDILDWDDAHPVNRFLDFDNLVVSETAVLKLPADARPLLRSTRAPLIALLETGDRGLCVVGFDPMKSNWPLLLSFPLFLGNCLRHFDDLQTRRTESNIAVGRPIAVSGVDAAPAIERPDARRDAFQRVGDREYGYADVTRTGIYRVLMPDNETRTLAANLFDRQESRLDVVTEINLAGRKVTPVQAVRQVDREYWRHLVMALAALLCLEWIVYHRRLLV